MKIRFVSDRLPFRFRGKYLLLLLLPLLPAVISGQECKSREGRLNLLFTGDIMGHDSQINAAYNDLSGTYDYNPVFRYIAPAIKAHDIAIGNLEVTLAGPPYKGYPLFSSPAALASAVRESGIGVLVTANNHSVDRGLEGIEWTISRLDSLGFAHTGTYRNRSEREALVPLTLEKNGIRLSLLNYTYGTNGINVPHPAVVDLIDTALMASDISHAAGKNTDAIVVFLHWGDEYDTLPSVRQKELAEWLFEKGVMLVIGSHPHVIQPVVLTRDEMPGGNRLVAYSLGNFVSNQRKRRTDGGMMLSVTLEKTGDELRIVRAGYFLTWVFAPEEAGKRKFYVLPASHSENPSEIPLDTLSLNNFRLFLKDSRRLIGNYSRGVQEISW